MHQPGVRKASWGHFGLSPSLSSPQDASDMVVAGRLKLSTVQPLLLLLLLLQLLMLLNTNTCNCYYFYRYCCDDCNYSPYRRPEISGKSCDHVPHIA